MKQLPVFSLLFFAALAACAQQKHKSVADIPHLARNGSATQLVVQDKPFLILGGELGNSSASHMGYMRPVWPKLEEMNLNTVLAPVYWELIEPKEGSFDFSLVDSLILNARAHNLKLIPLWFGSWKNSMSSYVPGWVKTNSERFPRAQDKNGRGQEILTPFSQSNLEADLKAFRALMQHISEVDSEEQTVIMVQVENEIGMLPDARDYHPDATAAFRQNVPLEFISYLQQHRDTLQPHVKELWAKNGFKTQGDWEQVFGKSLATDELFMAWHFARYTNEIAKAGKKIYPLPMYVNAALNRPNVKPGDYPSAGPLPHVMDAWKAAAPQIDFLSPDFYNPDFIAWNKKYAQPGNPLFIPEARLGDENGAQAFYSAGEFRSLGFSPFSIESTRDVEQSRLRKSYAVLSQITPLLLQAQQENATAGVYLDKENPTQTIKTGNYTLTVSHDYTLGWSAEAKEPGPWPKAGGIIITTGPNEFYVAGEGVVITAVSHSQEKPIAGFYTIHEGEFVDSQWKAGRLLNGDQSHQGRHVRIPFGSPGIQLVKMYNYK